MPTKYYKWWDRYDVDRHFRHIRHVARRMFDLELPKVTDRDRGADSERRHALTTMTDLMVERVMKRRSRRCANEALTEMSELLGSHPWNLMFDRSASARNIPYLHGDAWMRAWKTHFRLIVFAYTDLCYVEFKLTQELPSFMLHMEICDE